MDQWTNDIIFGILSWLEIMDNFCLQSEVVDFDEYWLVEAYGGLLADENRYKQ
jgi:hypothetical protein